MALSRPIAARNTKYPRISPNSMSGGRRIRPGRNSQPCLVAGTISPSPWPLVTWAAANTVTASTASTTLISQPNTPKRKRMKGSAGSTKANTAPAMSMRPRIVETNPSVTRQTDSKASSPLPKKGMDSSRPEPTATPEMAEIAPSAEAIRSWPKPARSAMGLPLSAMTAASRSMNSKRPATRPRLRRRRPAGCR